MPRKKLPYDEGDWFGVPLNGGGYGLGLIARAPTGGKILLGYFFGPKRMDIPELTETAVLTSDEAVLVEIFGDLGLFNGEWPIIGASIPWDREKWPLPRFVRIDDISGKASLIEYSEDDLDEIAEAPCDPDAVDRFPKDRLAGYKAVEFRLSNLLIGRKGPVESS